MKLKTLLIVAAAYMTLVAIGFIFLPHAFGIGAVPADASPALIAYVRLIGSPLLGIAVMDWVARNEPASRARNAIILGNAIGFGLIACMDTWGLFHEARPATTIFVVVHWLFALAFIFIGRRNWSSASAAAPQP